VCSARRQTWEGGGEIFLFFYIKSQIKITVHKTCNGFSENLKIKIKIYKIVACPPTLHTLLAPNFQKAVAAKERESA
jgi:hypothetical protein